MHPCSDLGLFDFTGNALKRYAFKCAQYVLLQISTGIVPDSSGCKDFHQKFEGRDPQSVIFDMQTSVPR